MTQGILNVPSDKKENNKKTWEYLLSQKTYNKGPYLQNIW